MKSYNAAIAPSAEAAPDSANERSLIQAVNKTITPFAQATNTAVAHISGQATRWLTTSHGCLCSQRDETVPACLDRACQPERICRTINLGQGLGQDGAPADRLIVCCQKNDIDLLAAIEGLVHSISSQIEMEQEQEMLMEELSASWESLEAIYEISSDLDLMGKPQKLLERILNRAVSFRDGLKVVLWIEREGMLYPSAKGLDDPGPRRREGGLIEKVMFERNGVILNGRSRIVLQNNLEPEFWDATNLAVVPLTSQDSSLGALAVWQEGDHGDFNSHNMRFLAALAFQASMVVENDRLHRAALESERLRQQVEIGSKIQQTLLLGQVPGDFTGLKVAALSIPSQMIDGDFYDFIKLQDNCLDVIIGDVMGKGIPAALVGAATKTHFLREMSQLLSSSTRTRLPDPYEIVACVHAELVKQLINLESFVTLCYARFDMERRQVGIVDCGHTRTVRFRQRTSTCDLLQGVNLPMGFSEKETYEQVSFELEDGDLFIFYSDGLTEASNQIGESYGEERLVELITNNSRLDPEKLVAEIRRNLFAFAGRETLADDLTCVAVRITETAQSAICKQARLEILSDLENLEACRAFVRNICQESAHLAVNEDFISQIELAVNEAVANVMRHAYDGCSDHPILLSAEVLADRMIFQIRHRGKPFDPNTAHEPMFDGSKDGGFGLFIIAQSVDEVAYTSDVLQDEFWWNCISLVKKFSGGIMMKVTLEVIDNVAVLVLPGENLDAGNVKEFKRDILPALDGQSKVILDMSELKFVDSSGLGAILSCLRQLNASGGELKLCRMLKPVRALFELVRMHRIFDLYNTREEALVAFRQ
ncbi:MAG: anti-sigma factor antagonist [Acidobacteriota bacterium]